MTASKYLEGAQAANTDGLSIDDNPYPQGTIAYEGWRQGFVDCLGDTGETPERDDETDVLEGADIMEVY